MAKTNRPLKVLVHRSLWDTPAVVELRAKGNVVIDDPGAWNDFDLILSPNAWRIVPGMENQIDLAIKAARKVKYGKKGEEDEG